MTTPPAIVPGIQYRNSKPVKLLLAAYSAKIDFGVAGPQFIISLLIFM